MIHKLTASRPTELRIDLGDFDNEYRYAKYNQFSVGSENNKFLMKVEGYSGNAGTNVICLSQIMLVHQTVNLNRFKIINND